MRNGKLWTHDELRIAMNLYCRTAFGQMHARNPKIMTLAKYMGRTSASLAMKLVNLASLDPVEKARGIVGLSKTSTADRLIWNEFHANWDFQVNQSCNLLEKLIGAKTGITAAATPALGEDIVSPCGQFELTTTEQTELLREVVTRRGQSFFRSMILTSYGNKCCLTGCSEPTFLIASHIVPWSSEVFSRLDPRNGICLSLLHDKAFDKGLISFDDHGSVIVSKKLRSMSGDSVVVPSLIGLEGKQLERPSRFQPLVEFFRIHRELAFSPNN